MEIGDRVYDKKINANGYIISGPNVTGRWEVQYFWGMHSKYEMQWFERTRTQWHTETPDKQTWVDFEALIITPMPIIRRNKVGMFANRVLNQRIGLIAEFPRYPQRVTWLSPGHPWYIESR